MIRTLLTGIICLSLLGSCSKSEIDVPAEQTAVFSNFKDAHIVVADVKVVQSGTQQVTVDFATRYEKDLKLIEVFGGTTTSNLCSIYKANISGDSHAVKTYTVVDPAAGADVNFYMIKYTTNSGDWSYTPLYQVKMK